MMMKRLIFRVCRNIHRSGDGRKRRAVCLSVLLVLLCALLSLTGCRIGGEEGAEDVEISDTSKESYGVFLGIDSKSFDVNIFDEYDLVVVDAQELRPDQLAQLHARGHVVYSYLNVGSIETNRDYFSKYKDLCLFKYENWPDEYWVDVTQKKWQKFTGSGLVDRIRANDPKVDGLFLDNLDIYYQVLTKKKYRSMKEDVYGALINILEMYQEAGLPVLVNGADTFVSRLIDEEREDLIRGVNQETVFSRIIDYDKDKFGQQPKKENEYYTEYLKACKKADIDVFLLEYTTDEDVEKKICRYCDKNGFRFYISPHVNLTLPDD